MVTVGIKVLNQATSIGAAIDSAIAAVRPFNGAVIVADSGSSDGTVDVALQRGVGVVQLADVRERCCGAAAQLAWQHSETPYFFMMDGDMTISADFLPRALAYLEEHPDVAGCGGVVVERTFVNDEYRIRNVEMQKDPNRRAGDVAHLDGGGLYRSTAIQACGYFSDKNLHAFEEYELGQRLRERGWRLVRLPFSSVEHSGYTLSTYRLLMRKAQGGYLDAPGEVLRAALSRGRLAPVLRAFRPVRGVFGAYAYWGAMAVGAASGPGAAGWLLLPAALTAVGCAGLAYRRRSVGRGVYSFVSWNLQALASIRGFLRPRRAPTELASVVLARETANRVL